MRFSRRALYLLLFLSPEAWGQGAASTPQTLYLLTDQDIPKGLPDCSEEILKKRSCEIEQGKLTQLQQRILENYTVPADDRRRPERLSPNDWVLPNVDPQRSLQVGHPQPLTRKSTDYVMPVFLQSELFYFQGESEVISELNSAIRYWAQGQDEEALALMKDLTQTVQSFDKDDVERNIVYMTRGFMDLDQAAKQQSGIRETTHSVTFWKVRARSDFFRSLGQADLSFFLSPVDRSFHQQLYLSTLSNAVFLRDQNPGPTRPPVVQLSGENIDPLVWIRSVAPTALFNMMILSRVRGQYSKAFSAAEKLEELSERLGESLMGSSANVLTVLSRDENPGINKTIYLRPAHINDLISLSLLVRAAAFIKGRNPIHTLLFADETIRRSHSRSLAAIGFSMMGHVYFDVGNLEWALRNYAWAEALDPNLLRTFPDTLLWGAESAFWLGRYRMAKRSFEALRKVMSDREYGPFVHLRLLQLELLLGDLEEANSRIVQLKTHYKFSPVMKDVVVLDYCLNGRNLARKLEQRARERVRLALEDASLVIQEQAEACILFAELDHLQRTSRAKDGKEQQEEARQQLSGIAKFREAFPKSPYLQLLRSRVKNLELADVYADLQLNRCENVLNFYRENEKALWEQAHLQEPPVRGMRWEAEDMRKVIRCAAFQRNYPLMRELQKRVEPEEQGVQQLFARSVTKPSSLHVEKLFQALVAEKGWGVFANLLQRVDLEQMAILDSGSFWRAISAAHVAEMEIGFSSQSGFYDKVLSAALERPRLSRQSLHCAWARRAFELGEEDAELRKRRVQILMKSDWRKSLLTDAENAENLATCHHWLVRQAINNAIQFSSQWTDHNLLWPYFLEIGPTSDPAVAFALAKRVYFSFPEEREIVVDYLTELADLAESQDYRRAASSWLREHHFREKDRVW